MIPVTYTRNGKNVGVFDGKTLRKKVNMSKHLFRKFDAWGLDMTLLDKVLIPAEAEIEIRDTQQKILYTISAKNARMVGMPSHFQDGFDDHGRQIFVPRSSFAQKSYAR